MPSEVVKALKQHRLASYWSQDNDLVFCHPHKGGFLSATTVRFRFAKALAASGVRKVQFHGLRHTYGTTMASQGTPMRALQMLMGHASIKTTEMYAKWMPEDGIGLEYAERAFAKFSTHATPVEPLMMSSDRP